MADVKNFIERLIDWGSQPKNYSWLVPLLVFLILIFVVRGCFSSKSNEGRDYYIGRDETWYPISFYGKEKNVLGFSDDLMLEVAKRKNLRLHLTSESSEGLRSSLEENVDGILSSISPDVTLKNRYLFSDPYYNLGVVLVVESNSPVKSFSELEGKDVGILRGSSALFNIPGHPNVRVVTYDSMIVMFDDVMKDKIDGALLDQLNAYNLTTGYYKGRLRIATPPLTQEGLRLVTTINPRDERLIQAFNEALAEIKAERHLRQAIR